MRLVASSNRMLLTDRDCSKENKQADRLESDRPKKIYELTKEIKKKQETKEIEGLL
jgi:hypothetical protein